MFYTVAIVVTIAAAFGVDANVIHPHDTPSLAFAHVYTDSMVLQRAPHQASVWGWAKPGATVTVTVGAGVSGPTASATAGDNGAWRLNLPPQPTSTAPTVITATDGSTTLTLSDVLFGDVYVCSGQSNMAFSVAVPTNDETAEANITKMYLNDPGASMNGTYVSTDEAINASFNYPDVRFLVVGNKHDCPTPIADFYPSPGNNNTALALAHPWQLPNASTIGVGKDVMGGNGGGEMSATCYYWGLELHLTQKIPIGLIHSSYGGSAVEDWIPADVLGNGQTGPCPGPVVRSMGLPSQQWNGQLAPLLNTTIKGTIWYQGESNHGQDELYACRYSQLQDTWREQWHIGTGGATDPEFPMGLVQIGPMTNDEGDNADSFLIRMGQTNDFGYAPNTRWPNSFMATAFDLANPPGTKCISGCIHIFNKQAVAHRLAVAARSMIYGESIVFSGPRIVSAKLSGSVLTVNYDKIGTEGKGIQLRGSYGFEVSSTATNSSGMVGNWTRVNVTQASLNTVTIDGVEGPIMALRYAWEDSPSVFTNTGPAVFNGEGLPATPSLLQSVSTTSKKETTLVPFHKL